MPFTLACWFNSDSLTIDQALITLSSEDTSWNGYWLMAKGTDGGDPVVARTYSGGAVQQAATTTGYSADTWHHACGMFVATSDRRAYIDGGSKGTDVNAESGADVDNTCIGAIRYWTNLVVETDSPMSGRIAEPAIWSCALTDLEVWLLSRGVPPPLIRPQSLAAYWPLWDTDRDVWNARYHMTPFNTPTWANHPPKVLDWWRKYGNRAQTQFALKQFISRQPYNLSYHKPQAFAPTGVTRIPRHPAQYNTLAIY